MKEILSGSTAKTNEEYRKVLKNRMSIMVIIAIAGIITAAVGLVAEFYLKTSINDRMLGVYTGVGISLFVISTILWIKSKFLLNNEEKLKKNRLNNTDERNQEISNKAFKAASIVMIIVLYATALIGGLLYPVLVEVLMFVICTFLLAYMIAYKHYNSKM